MNGKGTRSPIQSWTPDTDRDVRSFRLATGTRLTSWRIVTDRNRCRGRRSATCIPGGAYALPAVGGTLLRGRGSLVPEVADPWPWHASSSSTSLFREREEKLFRISFSKYLPSELFNYHRLLDSCLIIKKNLVTFYLFYHARMFVKSQSISFRVN